MTLVRLPAVAATGNVTFSRYTPLAPAVIPVGSLVRTGDGSLVFTVTADPTNPAWNAGSGAYVIPAGIASVTIPVAAQRPGSAGNVQTGTVTLLASAIPGVDTVDNQAPFTNGIDAEFDAALRARFQNFIQTRAQATAAAIGYAISSLQQGLVYLIQENIDTSSQIRPGNFVVTVDDGSGTPPASLLTTVFQAVDAVRPVGSTFSVQPPTVLVANPSLTISTSGQKLSLVLSVRNAIQEYIDTLPIGAPLALTRLAQLAYDAAPGVTNVGSIFINGVAADLTPEPTGVIKAGTVVVS